MSKTNFKQHYKVEKTIEEIFTGQRLALDDSEQLMITPCFNSLVFTQFETGKRLKEIKLSETDGDDDGADYIIDFAYSRQHLIIAYNSGLLRHFQLTIEQAPSDSSEDFCIDSVLLRTWKSMHIGPIASIRFDGSGEIALVATGGSDSTIKVWDMVNNYCTHNLKNAKGVISTIAFAPNFTEDQYHFLASGDDYLIHVWNLIDSKYVCSLAGHDGKITSIVYTADGGRFISASRDKLMIIWRAGTLEKERSIPIFESIESIQLLPRKHAKVVDASHASTSKEIVATAGESGLIKLWDYTNGQLLHAQTTSLFKIEQADDKEETSDYTLLRQLVYNRHQRQLIVVSYDKDIVFYDLDDLEPVRQLVGHNDEILDAKLVGDQQTHMAVATNSPKIKVFDLRSSNCYFLAGHTDIVLAVTVWPENRHLMASSAKDNTVRVWQFNEDCSSAMCLYYGLGHTHSVTSVVANCLPSKKISKGSSSMFFISGSEDTTIKYWKLPSSIESFEKNSESVAEATAIIAKATQSCHEKPVNSVDIAPNNELVATCSQDRTAKIWILPTFQLLGTLRGHKKGVWFARFSPIDQVLATGSADSTIKLWSINDLSCVKTFQGHGSSVLRLAFIDQGMQFISTSSDGNLKIWNIKTNECVSTFDAHEGKVWAFDISIDEEVLVTGGDDSTIKLWRDDTEQIKQKEELERETNIENEQSIQNLLHKKSWLGALKLAIRLAHPLRALQILKELLLEVHSYQALVEKLVENLRRDQLLVLFDYSLHWNTNSKHFVVGQCVLRAVLLTIPPTELATMPELRTKVQKLLPYTERHMARTNRVRQLGTFADFVYERVQAIDQRDD